jgi:GAF domain-containing protein
MTTAREAPSADRNTVLAALGDYVREIDNPDDLAFAAAELLGRSLNVSRAGYGTIDTSAETITINRDWCAPDIASLAGVLHFRDYGTYIENLKRGETVVCADARHDPRIGDRASALEAISARALVNMPISESNGVVALLYLNNATPREWSAVELELIREVAERTRTAVERRRAESSVRENEARLLFLDALNNETARTRNADECWRSRPECLASISASPIAPMPTWTRTRTVSPYVAIGRLRERRIFWGTTAWLISVERRFASCALAGRSSSTTI